MAALRSAVAAERDNLRRQAAQGQATQTRQRQESLLALYQKQLARATATGNTTAQTKLQKQIQDLQAQLKE